MADSQRVNGTTPLPPPQTHKARPNFRFPTPQQHTQAAKTGRGFGAKWIAASPHDFCNRCGHVAALVTDTELLESEHAVTILTHCAGADRAAHRTRRTRRR